GVYGVSVWHNDNDETAVFGISGGGMFEDYTSHTFKYGVGGRSNPTRMGQTMLGGFGIALADYPRNGKEIYVGWYAEVGAFNNDPKTQRHRSAAFLADNRDMPELPLFVGQTTGVEKILVDGDGNIHSRQIEELLARLARLEMELARLRVCMEP
ncbi:MAG: cytidine deaminase, partial [Phycisphaerales bacterium]|nr:cytidine deaminase [Phycisphaerales bacterium]